MILLEDDLPVALPIGLVGYKSYLPNTLRWVKRDDTHPLAKMWLSIDTCNI